MKKHIAVGIATVLSMVPALALAEQSGDKGLRLGAEASLESRALNVGDINADGRMDVKVQQVKGEWRDVDDDNDGVADKRKDAERRQDAMAKEDRGGRDERATSSRGEGSGFGKGGIRSFFSFFFGLPASTTVGELRAEIKADANASTSKSQGLGFWGRLFGAFRFGGNN